MKIGFLTRHDPSCAIQRSGVPFFIVHTLKKMGHDVVVIRLSDKRYAWERMVSRAMHGWYNVVLQGRKGFYSADYTNAMWRSFARQANPALSSVELLISIDLLVPSGMNTTIPMAVWTDNIMATYTQNPLIGAVCPPLQKCIHAAEKKVLNNLFTFYAASSWLAGAVKCNYPENAVPIKSLPRGAGLFHPPDRPALLKMIEERKAAKKFKVLFISSNWKGKGGDRILDIAKSLKNHDEIKWVIAGRVPEVVEAELPTMGITYAGYINKNDADDFARYRALLSEACLLVILSPAEGFGITYTEAARYGVPSVALAVMGVTEAVKHGITGILLPHNATNEDAMNTILSLYNDSARWENLCLTAWNYGTEHFDWGTNLQQIIQDCPRDNKQQ